MLRSSTRIASLIWQSSASRYLSVVGSAKPVVFPTTTSFVNIPSTETLLPEGFAGELESDLYLTDKREWMIRDATHLVLNLIDNAPVKNAGPANTTIIGENIATEWRTNNVEGYSDRPEWQSCQLQGQIYGTNIIDKPKLKGKLKDNVMDDEMPSNTGNNNNTIASSHESARDHFINNMNNKLDIMKDSNNNKLNIPNKILLNGERGVGKSTVLNQVVMHARLNGWICLFVPNGWEHVSSGAYIEPVRLGGQQTKGIFDNVLMSAKLLRDFHHAHSDDLKSIILKPEIFEKYNKYLTNFQEGWRRAQQVKGRDKLSFITLREIILEEEFPDEDQLDSSILDDFDYPTFEPKTLHDLLLIGVAFRANAGTVVSDLINELKNLDDNKPVLFAVDQYNAWEGSSVYSYRNELVDGFKLSVPSSLKFLSTKKSDTDSELWNINNGMFIASTSENHPAVSGGSLETYKGVTNSIPLTLTIPAYNKAEFVDAMNHYKNSKILTVDINNSDLSSFRTVTGSIGREVRREILNQFFPLASMDVLRELDAQQIDYAVYDKEVV